MKLMTDAEYPHAIDAMNLLLEVVGDDESHPLTDTLDRLANRIREYEDGATRSVGGSGA